ncbi:MAG TPA: DUF1501 domain-containing protein, partial [Gemmataceae bacterium]|nr:DUF1501 domain-containing protein [Gemmataceae bacterium]
MATPTPTISRRDWLRLSTAGALGCSLSGWLEALAADTAHDPRRRRSCILLWMNGGPSQTDTFDLKPGHENGGPYKEIATAVPGIRISEHLPMLAKHMKRMTLVRSMSTREGDHNRATFYLRTGYRPTGPIQYPALGSLISKELGSDTAPLPGFVSISPYRLVSPAAYSAGFLGPRFAPLMVGDVRSFFGADDAAYARALQVPDLEPPAAVSQQHADARIELLRGLEHDFGAHHPSLPARSHHQAYERAVRLMQSEAAKAFDLDEEKPALRNRYGRNLFGQGCLLARRLVERRVPFVEVTLGAANGVAVGWDTHVGNFDAVRRLSAVLDPAWSTLMDDLQDRGLLDSTLIVWMGEFGRTPKINTNAGRDHFPTAWTTVLAGGGIKGGQVVGRTSTDGTRPIERPVSVPDLLATACLALGIDPLKQNQSNVGRPIRIVDK